MSERKTPLGRLLVGMVFGQFGYTMATVIPLSLLLVFKFIEIDPQNITADFSIVTGIGAIINIVFAYVGGAISDRTTLSFGRRRTWIMIGSIVGAAALMGVGTAKSITMIVVCWCIALLFYNLAFASYSALIPDQVEEKHRGKASGIIGLFNPVAIVIGMITMTALNSLTLTMKFGVLSSVSIIGAIIACILVKDPPISEYNSPHKEAATNFSEKMARIYPSPKKYPYFSLACLTRFLAAVAFAAQTYATIYLMQKFGIAQEVVTGIATLGSMINTATLAIASVIGGVLSDKFRKQKPFVGGAAILLGIGVWIMAFAPSVTFYFISQAVIGCGFGMFLAVDIALAVRVLPNKEDAAKDFGIMNVANNIAGSIVPVIATPLIAMGGFALFYGVLGVAGLLSAAAVSPIPEMSPKQVEGEAVSQ